MPKVKIYTTATCGFCRAEKAYLSDKGVEYEEVRIDDDTRTAEEMVNLSGQMGVPFTVIEQEDGHKLGVLGFDQPKLSQALGL